MVPQKNVNHMVNKKKKALVSKIVAKERMVKGKMRGEKSIERSPGVKK